MLDLLQLHRDFFSKKEKYHKSINKEESSIDCNLLQQAMNNDAFELSLQMAGIAIESFAKSETLIFQNGTNYLVIAIDGSQIYPSRHENPEQIGLIKTAAVIFDYINPEKSNFEKVFRQKILFQEDVWEKLKTDILISNSLLDCFRQIEELKLAVEIAQRFRSTKNCFILLDAALNLAFLQTIKQNLALFFLGEYFSLLKILVDIEIPVFSYTSNPTCNIISKAIKQQFCKMTYFEKSKCLGNCNNPICYYLASKNDAALFSLLLAERQYSPVFKQNFSDDSTLSENLLSFYYLSAFSETVRIDFILKNYSEINHYNQFLLDQNQKGRGYPLALAEAHIASNITTSETNYFLDLVNAEKIISSKQKSKKLIFG